MSQFYIMVFVTKNGNRIFIKRVNPHSVSGEMSLWISENSVPEPPLKDQDWDGPMQSKYIILAIEKYGHHFLPPKQKDELRAEILSNYEKVPDKKDKEYLRLVKEWRQNYFVHKHFFIMQEGIDIEKTDPEAVAVCMADNDDRLNLHNFICDQSFVTMQGVYLTIQETGRKYNGVPIIEEIQNREEDNGEKDNVVPYNFINTVMSLMIRYNSLWLLQEPVAFQTVCVAHMLSNALVEHWTYEDGKQQRDQTSHPIFRV